MRLMTDQPNNLAPPSSDDIPTSVDLPAYRPPASRPPPMARPAREKNQCLQSSSPLFSCYRALRSAWLASCDLVTLARRHCLTSGSARATPRGGRPTSAKPVSDATRPGQTTEPSPAPSSQPRASSPTGTQPTSSSAAGKKHPAVSRVQGPRETRQRGVFALR
jgi:hypothetical protein